MLISPAGRQKGAIWITRSWTRPRRAARNRITIVRGRDGRCVLTTALELDVTVPFEARDVVHAPPPPPAAVKTASGTTENAPAPPAPGARSPPPAPPAVAPPPPATDCV